METGRRCRFCPSVYISVTYEGVSALGTDGHRQQTQTDAITLQLPSLGQTQGFFNLLIYDFIIAQSFYTDRVKPKQMSIPHNKLHTLM